MRLITSDLLLEISAYIPTWFESRFPAGGTWDDVIQAISDYGNGGPYDLAIYLTHICPADVVGAPDWNGRVAMQRDPWNLACLARECPADVFGAPNWSGRVEMQMDSMDCTWLAQICPADVPGAPDWEGRLAMQPDDWYRAELARTCPPDVPGAPDWSGRLALQEDDSDRAWLALQCPPGVPGATLTARLAMPLSNEMREVVLRKFGGQV
jgi:hypothetical protein